MGKEESSRGSTPVLLGWLMVVIVGVFIPLMDNDSAHHANIALRMYLTGDYVRLIDYDGPYLDKPHLHFWLSALSYHLFGVTGFAYKFPTLVFCIVGVYAVFRAATILISESAGRLAAIMFATSVSFLLGMNDVRMDGILCSAVAISVWQMAGFIKQRTTRYMLGSALGMAIGFSTKGHIGVFIPGLFLLSYCLFQKSWSVLVNTRVLLGIAVFGLLIAPVVYCYYLQYNLHPGVVVRGQDHINGVRFILLDQTLGRYGGEMGSDAKGDRLFFIHTFLWVFAPWSMLGVISLLKRGGLAGGISKSILFVLFVFGVLVGFSSFKLPHYLNVILPLSSVWVAGVLDGCWEGMKKITVWLEWALWILVGIFAQFLLIWWFPEQSLYFWVGFVLVLALLFYNIKNLSSETPGGAVVRIASAILVLFWMINAGFYSSLLRYQGGNMLANSRTVKALNGPLYSLRGFYSSSFYFYTQTTRQEISLPEAKGRSGYLLLDQKQLPELDQSGIHWERVDSVLDYEITRLSVSFLNQTSRSTTCTRMMLVRFN